MLYFIKFIVLTIIISFVLYPIYMLIIRWDNKQGIKSNIIDFMSYKNRKRK